MLLKVIIFRDDGDFKRHAVARQEMIFTLFCCLPALVVVSFIWSMQSDCRVCVVVVCARNQVDRVDWFIAWLAFVVSVAGFKNLKTALLPLFLCVWWTER